MEPKKPLYFRLLLYITLLLVSVSAFSQNLTTLSKEEKLSDNDSVPVASVNGVIITLHDLHSELSRIEHFASTQASHQIAPLDYSYMEDLTKKTITMLIEKELLLQECYKEKIEVPDSEITLVLNQLKSNFETEAKYLEYLKDMEIDEAFLCCEIEYSIMIQKFLDIDKNAGIDLAHYISSLKEKGEIEIYYNFDPNN